MSRPQEPHRPFFPFGNPFRMMSPKGSQLSQALLELLNSFEETLAERLRKLETVGDVLSLAWMKSAMESLCETHKEIKTLIARLELPVSDWDEKWIDVYLDISIKLLDISNAFSSELSRMNQGHLLLQCALHNLEANSPQQFVRARSSLDGWRRQIRTKNPRLQKCCSFLDGLMETLNLPKVKNSAKGKVLMRAMYGVKVQTLFICSVFVAAFSGSSKKLFESDVADTYLWAQDFKHLRGNVNLKIRKKLSSQSGHLVKELEGVDTAVEKLYPLTQNDFISLEEESLRSSVKQLGIEADKLSGGLNLLVKEVDGFFQIVLTGRDALLSSLRATCTGTDPTVGKRVGQSVV
ncbi:protein BPS1, chloroplastic-like [Punica granatum]|uniref:Protein BPS1, chloroplastic-like n=1 Tax=Punica granatum TaxID=22663 RepID=A0A6P8E3D3_PUNGR|nr:protein BPS1, chloroplastic-like [Punica granatum]XP_031404451.1 protein BPS1, chloroplastic-like [Punica granatum]XP_031404457.1 protein BPS1, chloroplastic-like [Punica granatum]